MFEYIRLHNFKSFEDVTVNLLDKQGNTKNLIIFFGANGCGNRSYDTSRPSGTSRPYSNAYHRSTAMLSQPDEGSVSAENAALIDHTEKMLNRIVPSLFPGIKAVRYGRDTVLPGEISYHLMIVKDISGTEHEVPLSYASDGIKNLLRQLPYICSSITGDSSAIDDFATGLHDVTATKLIEAVYDALASEDSTGQLILATHCTALMEAALPRESLFTITDTKAGDGTGTEAGKEINCITRYDPKIHRDANVRKQYLEGRFKGLPDIHISGSDLL